MGWDVITRQRLVIAECPSAEPLMPPSLLKATRPAPARSAWPSLVCPVGSRTCGGYTSRTAQPCPHVFAHRPVNGDTATHRRNQFARDCTQRLVAEYLHRAIVCL